MQILHPRLVVSTGSPGIGKSTVLKELARLVPNSFYLDRDRINHGILYVAETETSELLPFRDYVGNDNVFPNAARHEETMFGKMIQIDPKNAFHRRHARDQTHLIQTILAAENLEIGKVPIVDCFGIRQVRELVPKKFIELPMFDGFQKYMIHFTMDPEVHYDRVVARAQQDPKAAIRDREILTSRDAFHEAFVKMHGERVPAELQISIS